MDTLATAAPQYRVTEALLKTAGQFLNLIDPPCERMITVTDYMVSIFPATGAALDDQVEMIRRAGRFLNVVPVTRSTGRTITYEVRGTWAEVLFEVRTTFDVRMVTDARVFEAAVNA